MLQIFIAVMHNQKHSTQPPTLSPPHGDQVLFYSQDMDRLSPVSSIENNFYSRPTLSPPHGDQVLFYSQDMSSFFN